MKAGGCKRISRSRARQRMARLGLATLMTSGVTIGVGGALAGTAGAATSGAPITLAMITSLTGEGSSEFSQAPVGFNARIALQNAEGGVDGHKLVGLVLDDQTSPTAIVDGRAGRAVQGRLRHRLHQPALLLGRPVPRAEGRTGHGRLLRRTRVGHAALHEHVRRRRRKRGPQVPGQHRHRDVLEAARWNRRLLVRLRHLTVVVALGRRHRRLLRARRRQGRGTGHLDPVRFGGHDHGCPDRQAEGVQRLLRRPRRQLELRPRHGAQAGGGEAQGDGLPDRLRAEPGEVDVVGPGAGGLLRHHVPPVPAPQRRDHADAVGAREVRALHEQRSSRTSASTSPGSAPTS